MLLFAVLALLLFKFALSDVDFGEAKLEQDEDDLWEDFEFLLLDEWLLLVLLWLFVLIKGGEASDLALPTPPVSVVCCESDWMSFENAVWWWLLVTNAFREELGVEDVVDNEGDVEGWSRLLVRFDEGLVVDMAGFGPVEPLGGGGVEPLGVNLA